jgi:hypothetical protein
MGNIYLDTRDKFAIKDVRNYGVVSLLFATVQCETEK